MANEADVVSLSGINALGFTCAAGTKISKGTLLQISGDNTVSASSANSEVYGGVAASDKTTDDGDTSTTLAVHVPGQGNRFDMKCGAAVALGNVVSLSGANLIKPATEAEMITGDVIGKAEEAGDVDEVIVIYS